MRDTVARLRTANKSLLIEVAVAESSLGSGVHDFRNLRRSLQRLELTYKRYFQQVQYLLSDVLDRVSTEHRHDVRMLINDQKTIFQELQMLLSARRDMPISNRVWHLGQVLHKLRVHVAQQERVLIPVLEQEPSEQSCEAQF